MIDLPCGESTGIVSFFRIALKQTRRKFHHVRLPAMVPLCCTYSCRSLSTFASRKDFLMQLINADRSSSRMFRKYHWLLGSRGGSPIASAVPHLLSVTMFRGQHKKSTFSLMSIHSTRLFIWLNPFFLGPVIGIVGWVSATAAEVTIYVMQHKPIDFAWRKCLGTG